MGHRALVAYQKEGDVWTAYYSHWGALDLCLKGPLADGLEPGETTEIDRRLPTDGSRRVGIDPDARAERVRIDHLVTEVLDYQQHEALYTVPSIGEVGAYVTLDFRFHPDEPNEGALVGPRWVHGKPLNQHVTIRFTGWKEVYQELIDEDWLAVDGAKERLSGRVWSEWGKAPAPEDVPAISPRGTRPKGMGGTVNVSRLMARRQQRERDR